MARPLDPPSLLVVVPHPDDEAYAFGGTILAARAYGLTCHVICLSSGENGERHDGIPAEPAILAATREAELAASCAILGAEPPTFWRLPDGGLEGHPSQARRLALTIRNTRPAAILALGPDGAYGHPDHLAACQWLFDAWHGLPADRPALLWAAFPTGLFLPQYDLCIEMLGDPPVLDAGDVGGDVYDLEVDIRPYRDAKLASIAAHRSQLPGGDPFKLFPGEIVASLLDRERYIVQLGSRMTKDLPFLVPASAATTPPR